MKSILPYGSGIPASESAVDNGDDDVGDDSLTASDSQLSVGQHFETGNYRNEAAEKHAFLHSHAGLEDVF